ncbi:MAG: type II toxin-antitoxin system HicB family antitoxin [Lachnospiraceae bacterium]|nr:type II toxin-antitoxin system HicB family antitoxin [Lachnospiraceae bacterium]
MNNNMEYKGYHAIVEYDGQDKILVGTVIGLNDMLGFHGTSIEELTASFRNCIDNYLDWCKEAGKSPEKEFKGSFNVRTTPESHREAAMYAALDGITMNQYVSEAIQEKNERRKAMTAV